MFLDAHLRNVAVALGNSRNINAVSALAKTLHDEPLILGYATWALGQISEQAAIDALQSAAKAENDDLVIIEIQTALPASKDIEETT